MKPKRSNRLLILSLAASVASIHTATAVDLFWNPSPLAADWDTTTANWSLVTGGTADQLWTDGNSAVFDQASAYSVNVTAATVADTLSVSNGNVTLTGSAVSSDSIAIAAGATLNTTGDRIAKAGTTQVTVNGTLDLTAGGFSGGRYIQLGGSGNITGGFRHSGTASFGGNIQDVSLASRAAILWNGGTGGTLTLSGDNSGMTGDVLMSIANSVIKLDSATAFSPNSLLRFSGTANSNLIELATADFTLAWYTGSNTEGNGGVSWTGTNAGFYATGGDRNLTFVTETGGTTAASVVWGSNGLNSSTVVLGAAASTHKLTWTNDIDLNLATRTINVGNGAADVDAALSGVLSGTGASVLNKTGTGVLLLSNANTHAGGTTIARSANAIISPLRISNGSALGTGSLTIGSGGGSDGARLELTGGITVTNTIATLASRNQDAPNILNVSGDNTINSNILAGAGGDRSTLQSDSGKLAMAGNVSVRILNLFGAGDGEIQGSTTIGVGAYGLNKADGGTWTLADGNLNGNTATISGGKLVINGNLINASADVDGVLEFAVGSSQRFTPTTNGVSNNITGTGTLTLQGAFDIDLTGATITDGNSWTLVDVGSLTETFGASFTITDFTESANVWTRIDGGNEWTFDEATGILTLASSSGFSTWIEGTFANGTVPLEQQGPNDDFDNDGIPNLLEYVLTGDPTVSDLSILPDLVVTATDFEFTYSRLNVSLSDTVQTFEYGSDLVGWTSVIIPEGPGVDMPVGTAKVTVTFLDVDTDSVKISIPRSENVGGKLFGRLKVEIPVEIP